jgi:hypothetical protein
MIHQVAGSLGVTISSLGLTVLDKLIAPADQLVD